MAEWLEMVHRDARHMLAGLIGAKSGCSGRCRSLT
jgi:hypothetical protein